MLGAVTAVCFGYFPEPVRADANSQGDGEQDIRKVTLQLKWRHQFQFAGYYAALRNGYFQEEGLDVEVREGGPDLDALGTMLAGDADFCVAGSEVILARMKGEPTVACAVFFQTSPYILLMDRAAGIRVPSDLVGKRVVVSEAGGSAQFRAMLIREGVSPDQVDFVEGKWSVEELLEGKVDAISGYATSQAPRMRHKGFYPYMLLPVDYGIDFYGDTLSTTEAFAYENRETTEAMIRACVRGWDFAMHHPEEIADYIMQLPGVEGRLERWQLLREAELMMRYVVPDVVEMGHMNPGRWKNIALTYEETGIATIPEETDWLDQFVFKVASENVSVNLKLVGLVVCAIALIATMVVVWNMILHRKVGESTAAIRDQSRLNQLLLDTAMDAVVGVDSNGVVISWSGQSESIFGYVPDHAIGEPVQNFLPDILSRISNDQGQSLFERLEIEGRRVDGEVFPAEVSLCTVPENPKIWLNIFVRDTGERRVLEEKLRQSQKMQAIGQLAGGVAHDFNNLLTVIQGNAVLVTSQVNGESRSRLDEVVAATRRASELTRQLLAFSRRQPMKLTLVGMNDCVDEVGSMLRRLIGEDIELVCDFCEGSPRVEADQAMLEQVILNLAVNARDAMPQGGRLSIQTNIERLLSEEEKLPGNIDPGEFVRIKMADTGTGIEPEKLPHIFEPFFTTKDVGKGTGLGLATAFGIVQQHGGWMTVESEVGIGTEFSVWLPLCTKNPSVRETVPTLECGRNESALKGTETILLVEDEAMVRLIAKKILTMNGYRVIEAADGPAALEIWASQRGEIDLLVTDVVMPEGLTGHELAEKLKADKPELSVVYTSGYSAEIFRGEAVIPEEATFLPKPYLPDDLLKSVKENISGMALAS
ncbi:MAG: ABC transporter substrate-binding protein [Verrucomicrobiales bacterium]|nr:ABC transporter substrate-binding protein [Verrucomicrobiales bacterium]